MVAIDGYFFAILFLGLVRATFFTVFFLPTVFLPAVFLAFGFEVLSSFLI
jgi:hypothetical protein